MDLDSSASQSLATPIVTTTYLTVPELAQRWSCEAKLVYAEIAAGRLAGLRIGKKILRVSLEEIHRYEKAQTSKENKQ
jgi:excisionase family DNA binding protein